MDLAYILIVCIISAVFNGTYAELDHRLVNKKPESVKYDAGSTEKSESAIGNNKLIAESKKPRLENTKLEADDDKYMNEKIFDYRGDVEKQHSSGIIGHWGYDYDNKADYGGGDGHEYEGKKENKDDSDYFLGHPKDTYKGYSYNALARKTQHDVSCSYGVKFVAHPSDCTKFYQCAHSKPFLFTCPSGLYFNTDLDVCDWPTNVHCTNGISYDSSYLARHEPSHEPTDGNRDNSNNGPSNEPTDGNRDHSEPSHEPTDGNSHQSNYEPGYQNTDQNNYKSTSNSQPRAKTPSQPLPLQPPPMYSNTDPYQTPTNNRDYRQDLPNSRNPHFFPYPIQSNYHPAVSGQFLPISTFHFPMIPVMQSPMYNPFIHLGPGQNDGNARQPRYKNNRSPVDYSYKERTVDVSKEREDESTFQAKRPISTDSWSQTGRSSTRQSGSTGDGATFGGSTIKKVVIRGNGSFQKSDVPSKDKMDDPSNNHFYYYYYQDDYDDKDGKSQDQRLINDNKKNPYYYYYPDTGNNNNKYKNKKLSNIQDYNRYYDDSGINYDSGYDYTNGNGQVQQLVSVDKNYNKHAFASNGKYIRRNNQMSNDELIATGVHFDHRGRGTRTSKGKGNSLGGIGSLLPLLLLGGANGGQQLLMLSLLLGQHKSNGAGGKGGKGSSLGGNNDLFRKLLLLSLFTPRNGNTITPAINAPNLRIVNGNFVSSATGLPVVVIDGLTGLTVTPVETSINPGTGQLVVLATGNPAFIRDQTGSIQLAVVGNSLTIQGNPILPVNVRGGLGGTLNMATNTNNRFVPLGPIINGQSAVTPSGREAVNLIFLSPLTPSSLPPPIINNDGSATMIRGSLRDILGPNLSNFISNVPLVAGQGHPNSVAGNKKACNVVRSGKTVPFRISPRGERLLPSECDAIGKLLDKFVPTFLQNFVTSDAAFAGFGMNINKGNNTVHANPSGRPNVTAAVAGSSNINISSSSSNIDISSSNYNNVVGSGSINDFINVKNDHNGCTITVPNIVPQC